MTVLPTRLEGLILLAPTVFRDPRGFFFESYRADRYLSAGIPVQFVQDNHSRSLAGTVRGLHFQQSPGQAKLVRVARGRAWDVIVDIRRGSPTFGEWEGFELDDEQHHQLYIPVGFAHGFCALSDVVDLVYKVGSYYDLSTERGIAWDDPDIGIEWPIAHPVLSERDRHLPRFTEVAGDLPGW